MEWLKQALAKVYADRGLRGVAIVVGLAMAIIAFAMWMGIDIREWLQWLT